MRPIATAQTTYASGAAAPSAPAAAAGRRKIPPPTVTLTMLAARPHVPEHPDERPLTSAPNHSAPRDIIGFDALEENMRGAEPRKD